MVLKPLRPADNEVPGKLSFKGTLSFLFLATPEDDGACLSLIEHAGRGDKAALLILHDYLIDHRRPLAAEALERFI